jgi:hypothetical protein
MFSVCRIGALVLWRRKKVVRRNPAARYVERGNGRLGFEIKVMNRVIDALNVRRHGEVNECGGARQKHIQAIEIFLFSSQYFLSSMKY